jgi:hypothetical protein
MLECLSVKQTAKKDELKGIECESSTQELNLSNLIFLHFLIFAVKLSHIVIQENNAIAVKWPSLIVKNRKMFILRRKKFG